MLWSRYHAQRGAKGDTVDEEMAGAHESLRVEPFAAVQHRRKSHSFVKQHEKLDAPDEIVNQLALPVQWNILAADCPRERNQIQFSTVLEEKVEALPCHGKVDGMSNAQKRALIPFFPLY